MLALVALQSNLINIYFIQKRFTPRTLIDLNRAEIDFESTATADAKFKQSAQLC